MSRALIVAACIDCLALASPALSRPLLREQPPALSDRAASAERISLRSATKPVFAGPSLVAEARKYMGTNPTDRRRLWCATFMNFVLAKLGYAGTNSDAAASFAYYGRRISEPQVGAIAVLSRGKRGGHVGVVSGIDAQGNPIIISGNHNKRVGEAVNPRSRVVAYVMATERRAVPTAVAGRTPASAPSAEAGLESPITELFAAIEAEQARAEKSRPPQPHAQTRAGAERPRPAAPPRLDRQTAEAPAQHPLRGSQSRVSDPFSELFERLERAPAQASRQPQARRSGRVAAVETDQGIR